MEDFKVKTRNSEESQIVQELLENLGFDTGIKILSDYIFAKSENGDKQAWNHVLNPDLFKEITIQELKDLVVLKRNDVGDANYIRHRDGQLYFVNSSKTRSYYMLDDEWTLTKWDEDQLHAQLKPIKEEVMKEYLFKYNNQYTLVELSKEDAESNPEQYIEVPDGATYYAIDSNLGIKKNYFFRCPNDAIWVDSQWMSASFSVAGQTVLWQRQTQPEELPFMDSLPEFKHDFGAPSLNDQYAEIEQVRQQTIEATLAERQAQYGCFEDVAFVTENIMATLSKVRSNGLNDLPYPHRMALYMIASKMARIVNGDFNSIDGWHDISGYATLVERLIDG